MIVHRICKLLIKPYTNCDCLGKSSIQHSFHEKIECRFKADPSEMLHLEHNFDTGTWTLQEVDKKYLGSFEIWYHRRMEKTSCTDRVKSEEVLCRVEARNILHAIKRRNANCLGHILCGN